MTDQFQISPLIQYSGSIGDITHYRDIRSTESVVSIGQATSASFITASFEPFRKAAIYSKAVGKALPKIKLKSMLWSERLGYKSGSLGGSRTQLLYSTAYTEGEQFADSFVPSPIEISKRNGVSFAFFPSPTGTLDGSTEFNLPASLEDIPIFFGSGVPADLATASGAIDTTWLKNPYPFQARYKNLNRIFQPSFQLPNDEDISLDFASGSVISPVSKSNLFGTMYYVSDQALVGTTNIMYKGEFSFDNAVSTFTEFDFPSDLTLTTSFYGSVVNGFGGVGNDQEQVLIGASGTIIHRDENESTSQWNVAQSGLDFDLFDASHSRGPNVSLTTVMGNYCFVGSRGKIQTAPNGISSISDSTTAVTGGGTFAKTWYGVDNHKIAGTNPSGHFIVVGEDGEIQYSTDYQGTGTWNRHPDAPVTGVFGPSSGSTYTIRDIAFCTAANTGLGMWIHVGDNGNMYFGTNVDGINGGGQSVWNPITSAITSENIHFVHASYAYFSGDFYAVVGGENGFIATYYGDGSLANIRNPNSWDVLTASLNYNGTFYGASRISQGASTTGDYLFYVVGSEGMVAAIKVGDPVGTAEIEYVGESPDNTTETFRTVTDRVTWGDPGGSTNRKWDEPGPFIIAGESTILSKAVFGRVVDVVSEGYTYQSGSQDFVHNSELETKGGTGLLSGSKYVRSKLVDEFKTYFGFGKGARVSPGSTFDPPDFIFLPGAAVEFADAKVIVDSNQPEFFRFIGPTPAGYRYGLLNVQGQSTKAVFRRDRYGQNRDMLEQRRNSKFFLSTGEAGTVGTSNAAITISFLSGSTSAQRAETYQAASEEVSFNRKDSGIYDFEYKAGQPFYDDQIGLT